MDLDDEELKETRKRKGLVKEDKISEEEIINSINPIVNARKTHKDDNLYSLQLNAYQLDTIQGLLDLYNKEKEKKDYYKECLEVVSKELDNIDYDQILFAINDKFISKDKIKEIADDYESKGYIEIAGAMRELLEERN